MSNLRVMKSQPGFSLGEPRTFQEAKEYATLMANSSFVPDSYKGNPGDILVAVQMGNELGLKPLQALQNISVIRGRPCVWGDALPAVAQAHPMYEYMDEKFDEDTLTATCIIKRKNAPEQAYKFSQADARVAGLWGKSGPWSQYPKRMLQLRARGFAIRNVFADALKGINMAEEVQDYPEESTATQNLSNVIEGSTAPEEQEAITELSPEAFEAKSLIRKAKSAKDIERVLPKLRLLSEMEKGELRNLYKEKINELELGSDIHGDDSDNGSHLSDDNVAKAA